MNKQKKHIALLAAIVSVPLYTSLVIASETKAEKLPYSFYGDIRLRYETVEQDNLLEDASALTLRSRFGLKLDFSKRFSARIEVEDSRAAIDDYHDTIGANPIFSVVADPEITEIDQAVIRYEQASFDVKLGRQVITLDNHRFVGHVGWRQDRQTFDALSTSFNPTKEWKLSYHYIDKRNRIFADEKDLDSKDHLLNSAYETIYGKLSAYAYLLEIDNDTPDTLDTYGLRFVGQAGIGENMLNYAIEYATQESNAGATSFNADYFLMEAGIAISTLNLKLGYEVLGSDQGNYGFSTPLATLHKFNGWTDSFLGTPSNGLNDLFIQLNGKLTTGKWSIIYHDFSADDSEELIDDLGRELDLVYSIQFMEQYNAGIKYATYSAGDVAVGKVDTDKFWLWISVKF